MVKEKANPPSGVSTDSSQKEWIKLSPSLLGNIILFFTTVVFATSTFYFSAASKRQTTRAEFRDLLKRVLDATRTQLETDNIKPCALCAPASDQVPRCGPLGATALEIDEVLLQQFEVNSLQAFEIAKAIPDSVSAMELLALARALFLCGHYDESRECMEISKHKKDGRSIGIELNRTLLEARLAFSSAARDEGIRKFEEAVRLNGTDTSRNIAERDAAHVHILLTWVSTEIYYETHTGHRRQIIIDNLVEARKAAYCKLAGSFKQERMMRIADSLAKTLGLSETPPCSPGVPLRKNDKPDAMPAPDGGPVPPVRPAPAPADQAKPAPVAVPNT